MSKDDDRSELEKRFQQERIKELAEIRKGKIDLGKFQEVNDSLGNKIVAHQSEFVAKGKKQSGVSAGYIATKAGTDETFILKHFYKNHDDCLLEPTVKKQEQAVSDRQDGVRELFGSTMYQFLLYDRAPKEELVTLQTRVILSPYTFDLSFSITWFQWQNLVENYSLIHTVVNLKKLKVLKN